MDVQTINPKKLAADIREFAAQVDRGDFIAVAFAIVDKEGDGGHCCCIDQHAGTPEMIDAMVHDLKAAMFESFEDGR